ncbi:MAG: hypothetical protein AAGA77_22745 [Bacteroidota bacterium]
MTIKIENLLLILFLFIFSMDTVYSQSKFEFGLGLMINHSSINQSNTTVSGPTPPSYNGLRLPAVTTRIGYKINDTWHLNTGPGISWLGALEKDHSNRIIASTLELPLQLEWNATRYIHLASGPIYNYIMGIKSEDESMDFDLIPQIKSRHQFGFRHTISFSYELVELSLHYAHYLSDVFNFMLTDVNGNFVGTSVSQFGNIQLGIVIRR